MTQARAETDDGAVVRLCPGWKGNKYRCGKGEPRVLKGDADLCTSCRLASEKAGDRVSRAKQAELAAHEEYLRRLRALIDGARERVLAETGTTLDEVTTELIRRLELPAPLLTRKDWRLTSPSSYDREYDYPNDAEPLPMRERYNVLRVIAGAPIPVRYGGEW